MLKKTTKKYFFKTSNCILKYIRSKENKDNFFRKVLPFQKERKERGGGEAKFVKLKTELLNQSFCQTTDSISSQIKKRHKLIYQTSERGKIFIKNFF